MGSIVSSVRTARTSAFRRTGDPIAFNGASGDVLAKSEGGGRYAAPLLPPLLDRRIVIDPEVLDHSVDPAAGIAACACACA
eukprot:354248-Chlamydomonas_euryale.AAC.1